MSQPETAFENLTSEQANTTGNATARFQASVEGMTVAYSGLLFMALFPIVVGSFKSVGHVAHQKIHGKKEDVEVMTDKDAMMFPIYGSGVLLSIYLVFRFIDKELVNVLFTVYFFVLGVLALARVLEPLIRKCVPLPWNVKYKVLLLSDQKPDDEDAAESEKTKKQKDTNTFVSAINSVLSTTNLDDNQSTSDGQGQSSKENEKSNDLANQFRDLVVNYNFDYLTLISIAVSCIVGVWYLIKKHWIANNLFGLAFSISGIEFLQLNKVSNGCILLGGLFFYDVFWVFATDVMVTVAKSFEAPIKLIIPQDIPEKGIYADNFAMLGLGDIVIPGIFVALCLRIDYSFASQTASKTMAAMTAGAVKKVYFLSAFFAYIMGLVLTITVMHYFKHAQPALLYLVPACLGVPLFVGLSRGELKPMFEYVDNSAPAVQKEEEKKDN